MTVFFRPEVAGERVRIIALPAFSKKAVKAWEAFTRSDSIFGLDIEGTSADEGLGTYDPAIKARLVQFGNRTESWVLDPADRRWLKRIRALLTDESKRFVAHNAAYDSTRVLVTFNIGLGERIIDTLPMAALCWPGRTKPKGLKPLSDEFIDDGLSEAEHRLHARFVDLYMAQKPRKTRLLPLSFEPGVSACRRPGCKAPSWPGSLCGYCEEHYLARKPEKAAKDWGWANIPLDNPEYLLYAGLDAIYVRRLLDILAEEIKRRKMAPLSRTEQRVKRYMTDISVKGLRVDAEWTSEILNEVGADFDAAEDRVLIATGGIKARSPQLKDWLGSHGVKVKSLDKDHLPGLVEKYGHEDIVGPVLLDLQHVNQNSNLLSNLRTIMRHATEGDGYVHPNINTLQAHTGRMSATDPAVQTLAKKGEKGYRLRGCFIAREGHILIGADYDSQEVRIAAALSRDEMLLKIVLEGLNQHVLTAENIYPGSFTNKAECPDQYAAAKTLDFAQQYGAWPKKIAQTLTLAGIPTTETEATILWQKWRHTYAGYVAWSERLAKQRYVRNPFGRVIPRDPYRDYANANYMIQSTGRDVLGEALCRLADAGWAPHFWLPIHDELIMEVPEDRADECCAALTEHMSTVVEGIEIPAEGEVVGTRWKGLG